MTAPSYCLNRFTDGFSDGVRFFWPAEGGHLVLVGVEPHPGILVKPTVGKEYVGQGKNASDAVIDALGRMGCM